MKALLDGLGTYPTYFHHLRDLNRMGPAVLGLPQPALPILDLDAFRHHIDRGATVIDTRPVRT